MSYGLTTTNGVFESALRSLALGAGELARYCDHAEHVERTNRAGLSYSAQILIAEAQRLAEHLGIELLDQYGTRLSSIESINVLQRQGDFDGGGAARRARSWRALQEVQSAHDRYYHPDVFGLQRIEQLRHCALHYSKLVASIASVIDRTEGALHDFETRRLPDMLLFGLKLFTLMGERMPDDAFDLSAPTARVASPGSPS